MAGIGDVTAIAHILKRAYALYEGCKSAPEEIYLAREHVHAMALCLEGVHSDLLANHHSFVHRTDDTSKTRQHALKVHVRSCARALERMEALLKTGMKEIAEAKADLVMATSVLDMFLSKESLGVLWKLESMIEALTHRISALEAFDIPAPARGQARSRSGSNITRTIVVSLVFARLMKTLRAYRQKKVAVAAKNHKLQTLPRRLNAVRRKNSGFKENPKRDALMQSYASDLVSAAEWTPPPPYVPQKPRLRTPSPEFYYLPSETPSSDSTYLIRRSSSMQRLLGRLDTREVVPIPPKEHYACWKVGLGKLAFGARIAPRSIRHRRGQMQLRKLAAVLKEAGMYDSRAVTEGDTRVKWLLERKREEMRKTGSKEQEKGKKWYFVAGRVVGKDPGKTGGG
ncbi:hypothetical protein N0V90_000214 [Kalmusia sp. IMI 367209]|nr:hypothetical protein N0V90_000214 [Kalmusia sp. IMI 367209]